MQIKNLAFWLVNKSAIQKENGFFWRLVYNRMRQPKKLLFSQRIFSGICTRIENVSVEIKFRFSKGGPVALSVYCANIFVAFLENLNFMIQMTRKKGFFFSFLSSFDFVQAVTL